MKSMTSATGSSGSSTDQKTKKSEKMTAERFEMLTREFRAIAKEAGLTPEDIPGIIKEVRREIREKREQMEKRECA